MQPESPPTQQEPSEDVILEIEILNDFLSECLLVENYELACVLRDRLRRMDAHYPSVRPK